MSEKLEQIVLSNLLKSEAAREKYLSRVAPTDFGSKSHTKIYNTLIRLTQSTGKITKEMVQEAVAGDIVLQMQCAFLFDYGDELTPEIFAEFKLAGQKNRLTAIRDYITKEIAKGMSADMVADSVRTMLDEVSAADSLIEVSSPEQSVEATQWILDRWSKGEMPVTSGLPELDAKLFLSQFIGYWIIAASSGTGKALALHTEIPTPSGWTTMDKLKVGDQVFDEAGNVTNVVAATNVMHDRPCYRVVFSDGSEFIADAGHQWLTESKKARGSRMGARKYDREIARPLKTYGTDQTHKRTFPSVVTTEEIARTLRVPRTPGQLNKNTEVNHTVLVAKPINLPEQELPLSPYVLGAWLGDGNSASSRITCAEPELLDLIRNEGVTVIGSLTKYAYNLKGLNPILRDIGVLGFKHVPLSYRRAATHQRLALLQGLMDTDGHADTRGRCELTLTNYRLASSAFDLICSLGIKATMVESDAKLSGNVVGSRWRIGFQTSIPVFRLARKLSRQKLTGFNGISERRYILRVERVESEPVRCIQVDSPSHLFLVGRTYIPTHNSALMVNIAKNNARRGIPATLCSLEMSRELLYIRMAMEDPRVAGLELTEQTVRNERKMSDLKYAVDSLKKLPLYVVQGVSNIFRLDKISRRNAVDKGCKLTLFDYIQLGKTHPTDSDVVRVSGISRVLQGLTVPDLPNGYHGQAVLALSQYNGEGSKLNSQAAQESRRGQQSRAVRRAGNDDLAWSSQIRQDADGILHMYSTGEDTDVVDVEIFCGKQRNYKANWNVSTQFITSEQRFETFLSRKARVLRGRDETRPLKLD